MEKANSNYDMSLIKFLQIYCGVNPWQVKYITHKDAFKLFDLKVLTDTEFWDKHSEKDLKENYIRVKDRHNIIMYYEKLKMLDEQNIITCNEMDFNAPLEIENYFMLLQTTDIKNLNSEELYQLKRQLKNIKKYIGKCVDGKIGMIDKQLSYIKRRNKK